jgi:maleate isomerase
MQRLGIIYPEDDDETPAALNAELRRFAPADSEITIAWQPHPEVTAPRHYDADYMRRMWSDPCLEALVRSLNGAQVSAVAYACTSGSFIEGLSGEVTQRERLQSASSVPVTTTSAAVVAALRAVGARSVSVVTPYLDDVHRRFLSFLGEAGFAVASDSNLGLERGHSSISPGATIDQATATAAPTADALFISCTGQKLATRIAELEDRLGMPVVTSNQATFWELGRLLGKPWRLHGRGLLFGMASESKAPEPVR